jgi:hypothetical protein
VSTEIQGVRRRAQIPFLPAWGRLGQSASRLSNLWWGRKRYTRLFPCYRVKEDVRAPFVCIRLLHGFDARLLCEPELQLLVIPPVTLESGTSGIHQFPRYRTSGFLERRNVQLLCRCFLNDIAWLRVKNKEEGLIGEVGDLCLGRRRLDVIARGQVVVWLDGQM